MSTIIKDSFGNEFKQLDPLSGQTLTDTRVSSYDLGAVNAETVLFCANTNSVAVDVRGTFVGTMVLQYSIDGINYGNCPIFNPQAEQFVNGIAASGQFVGHLPSGTKQVRTLMTAYTSGLARVSMRGSFGTNFLFSKPIPTTLTAQATAAIGVGATLTIPLVTSLFHYITKIRITKYVGATLTPTATPVIVTTTNITTTPSFDFKTLGSQGDIEMVDIDFATPLKSSGAGANTTFVAPALAGAIWRLTAFYYVGL